MNFRETLKINDKNHLQIGNFDSLDLVKKFGTPLYVIDGNFVEKICKTFDNTIKKYYKNSIVCYASKALDNVGMYSFVNKLGLNCDCVSKGEIYMALQSGFDASKITFHGNNKTIDELEFAIKNKVGIIAVDNELELERIDKIAKANNLIQNIIIRVNPGVEAHTHSYIQTATVDSKFGSSIGNGDAESIIKKALKYNNIKFSGIHCHIGSQIFEKKAFVLAIEKMTDFAKVLQNQDIKLSEINFGGGYGIYYTDEDKKDLLKYEEYMQTIAETFAINVKNKNLGNPILMIEPGRAIVGEAGVTLYNIGTIKEIRNIRKYINVDGGMFDNPRYALYNAKYSALLANRANDKNEELVTVAGKCCESGDIVIKDILLPKAKINDTLAVFSTGAYNYSMASNYNGNFVPPMVMTYNDNVDYIVKPQSLEDLVRNQVVPNWLK